MLIWKYNKSGQTKLSTFIIIVKINSGDYVFTSLDSFSEIMGWGKGAYNAIISKSHIDINKDLIYMINTPSNLTNM